MKSGDKLQKLLSLLVTWGLLLVFFVGMRCTLCGVSNNSCKRMGSVP